MANGVSLITFSFKVCAPCVPTCEYVSVLQWGWGGGCDKYVYILCVLMLVVHSEPVWPSSKALGYSKWKDLGSIPLRLSFLVKKVVVCGHCLVTLSIISY